MVHFFVKGKNKEEKEMKVSKSFRLEEFVPKEIYEKYKDQSIWFSRPEVINLAQSIRDYFGRPMTINNWHSGGKFNERGFRLPDSKIGAKLSQHKLAGAIDFTIDGISPDEVRSSILENPKRFLDEGLTTIEDGSYTPTWTHVDVRNTGLSKILIVKPSVSVNSVGDSISEEYYFFDRKKLIKIKNYSF